MDDGKVFGVKSPSRFFAWLLSVLLSASIANSNAASASRKPNVVVILIDDFGWSDLGCYGSKFYRTPNIDRMAAEGIRFTDAYAACSVCSPTRAALLTGKYPARLHLTDWLPGRPDRPDQKLNRPVIAQSLPLDEVTIAEELKRNGYATAIIGKWHLGGEGFEPEKQGFDLNIAGDHTGTPRSYFAPYKGRDGQFMPGLEKAPDGEYLTDRLTAEAEKFIEQNRAKPFLLYLPHYATHTPIRAKPEVAAKYTGNGQVGQQTNSIYAAMVEGVDDSVGRILKKLDELHLAENTLIIFTADNGGLSVIEGPNTPATINAPLREGKGYLYEGGNRVPFIVWWPGFAKAGVTNPTPVCSIDLFPTLMEVCGVKSSVLSDGVSLSPLFRGESIPARALYWHYPHYSNQGGKPGAAIREGDFKLIEFYETGRWELFNVKSDFRESRNLVEEQPEVAKKLGTKLDAWRRSVGAQMMLPNPSFVPNPQDASGTVVLPARTADVQGLQLRYEPLPHKNTLGFWVRAEDSAGWEFQVTKPGKFTLEILQGCGTGQGGSEVAFTVAGQTVKTIVEDTGHFQNFKARDIGTVTIDAPGRYSLSVSCLKKAKAAVMDLRQVTLKPVL